MNLLRNLTIFIFLIAFISCTNQQQDIQAKGFSVAVKSIKGDTIISSAVYYDGHIICLQEDSKIFVLDTVFNRVDSLTAQFSKLKVQFLHAYNDTILLLTGKDIFYLDKGFVLKKYNNRPFKYRLPFYNDSTYYIYGCSAGEWGGSVFFWDKKTNKIYSYPATGIQQVLKFKDNYIVSSFLAHMGGFSDYLSIKDPTKLYELKDERQKTFCNWWSVDSLKNLNLVDTITPPGVKYYEDEFTTRTLTVFPFEDTLYSVYCTDSATILAKHVDHKLIPVDTLLSRKVSFYNASTHAINNISITAYNASWGTYDSHDKELQYQNTGLLFRVGNKITFLSFKTPHMYTDL
jgi:hypothetical protein